MPENILVVEYEPRYTDRVKQALAGHAITPRFARDGEEAIRALDSDAPGLIVLSSVVPKVSTTELIRLIRTRQSFAATPILITVSGYNGRTPTQDAMRMGASDILPKPYSEAEFLGKVQQLLGIGARGPLVHDDLDSDFTVFPTAAAVDPAATAGQLTSNDIFGDLLDDDKPASTGATKSMKSSDDLDKMLADTLAGVRPTQRKKDPAAPSTSGAPSTVNVQPAVPKSAADPKARPRTSEADLDKMLNDTLSGLERTARPRVPTAAPGSPAETPKPVAPPPVAAAPPAASRPAPPPAAPAPVAAAAPITPTPIAPAPIAPVPAPAAPVKPAAAASGRYNTDKIPALALDEKVPVTSPVFPRAVPPAAHDEPGDDTQGTRFGQYVLVERIATGGMAEVWKAQMRGVEGFQKTVAIKKILPHLSDNQDFIEMFIDEAKLAAQLNHNNITHIYDLGKIQSSYYIAMEYIDGHDLKTILKRGEERGQPMSYELALFIASKIAAALDYAHRKRDFEDRDIGLVHRDVSPQNVLMSQEGDIKLCDFGIAKAASKASHTQAGALKGKLQYMSPEQAWGKSIDRRSDIFALATVLFEMLTGRKLFTGDNELSILEQVREARVTAPSLFNDEVTPEIDAIVLKALQRDPSMRYQTAGEMAKDLDAVLYSIRPTPTSADLAIYMHRIWSPEMSLPHSMSMPQHEPEPDEDSLDTKIAALPKLPPVQAAPLPVAVPLPAAAPAYVAEPAAVPAEPEKKLPIVPIAIAAFLAIALLGYFLFKPKADATAATATTAVVTRTTATTATSAVPLTASSSTAATAPAAGTQAPAVDESKVDAEVRKRLEDARAKLEAEKPQAQTASAAPVVVPRANVPAPVTPTVPQAVAEQRPAPTPVVPASQPVVENRPPVVAPAPAPAQAAEASPARARQGDLVTSPDVAPKITRRAPVSYPPMARSQKIEGMVIVSALVSETGQVLETRIVRGVARGGLNDAAEQTVRRSTFAPATKDGARVKAWSTVSIDFKL